MEILRSFVYWLARQLVATLRGFLDPFRPYGTRLFNALARVSINVAVEMVCLRRNPDTSTIEVYLT